MGRLLVGEFAGLFGLWVTITSACFHVDGKYEIDKQQSRYDKLSLHII
jgi:hypothetical protein